VVEIVKVVDEKVKTDESIVVAVPEVMSDRE
jgi:hypothetical protein